MSFTNVRRIFPSVDKCPLCHVSDAASMSSAVVMKLIHSSQAGERFWWNNPNVWMTEPPSNGLASHLAPWTPHPYIATTDPDNLWEGDVNSAWARQCAYLVYRRDIRVWGFDVACVCSVLATSMLHGCTAHMQTVLFWKVRACSVAMVSSIHWVFHKTLKVC